MTVTEPANSVPSFVSKVHTHTYGKALPAPKHPLDPLTPDEVCSNLSRYLLILIQCNQLTAATYVVRQYIATKTPIKAMKFILCNLLPPPKRAVLAHLGIPLQTGIKPEDPVPIIRKAEVDVSPRLCQWSY
jgi:primary-amine oxidase